MIVKRTPGYLSYLQKLVERIVLPQFVDNSDLIPALLNKSDFG